MENMIGLKIKSFRTQKMDFRNTPYNMGASPPQLPDAPLLWPHCQDKLPFS